jgi:soluble lytic murein transglycosylase-like protein
VTHTQLLTVSRVAAGMARLIAGFAIALALANSASARTPSAAELESCFVVPSKEYGVNVYLIIAIALHESNLNPRAINSANFDDSEDIGIMQINSWWLSNSLHKYGIDRDSLWNPCLNIKVGTWILAQEIAKHGRGWTAIGYYNARSEDKRLRYIERIRDSLARVYRAYGIVDANPDDPTRPTLQVPRHGVTLNDAFRTDKRPMQGRKSTAGNYGSQRKIIVVSADAPQRATE